MTRLLALGCLLTASTAFAVNNEPPACLSPNASDWPAPSRPYFMILADTSSSMASPLPLQLCSVNSDCSAASAGTTCTCISGGPAPCGAGAGICNGVAPSCAGYPSDRGGHLRCGLLHTFETFAGQVNFGLAGGALAQSACSSDPLLCAGNTPFSCFGNCSYTAAATDPVATSPGYGCGPIPGGLAANRESANLLVPLLADHFWLTPPATCTFGSQCPSGLCTAGQCQVSNLSSLVSEVDNSGAGNNELWASGKLPINGMLRDANRYLSGTYVNAVTGVAAATPLDPTNERSCRSINLVLVVSGDENCDTYADATSVATSMNSGITVGNFTWNVQTHVIALVGGKNAAVIAGTGASSTQTGSNAGHGYFFNVTNEAGLYSALDTIIRSAVKQETCDNLDNDCNGCTDEGFHHYCDVGQSCCNLAPATCLANFAASISLAQPEGDKTQLPCTSTSAGATPATWLCNDPGDVCDNADNDCNGQIDEGAHKCGAPLHCPQAETCNGKDDDCDGVIDDTPAGAPYSVCPGLCRPTPEICDGCDNDCDGIVDNGIASEGCSNAASSCTGTTVCTTAGASVAPGGCIGGGTQVCNYAAQGLEVCDGADNDCDGIVDNITATACVPGGAPTGLSYAANSQCKMGHMACVGNAPTCVGWIGPSPEVCDGIDNNCDGTPDNGIAGQPCGSGVGACSAGVTQCIAGALICHTLAGPSSEICDGVDNDCNGETDDIASTPCVPNGTPAGLSYAANSQCKMGHTACSGNATACVGFVGPSAEVCDGIDNDCDGSVDDGTLLAPVGQACSSDVGECKSGVMACVGGAVACSGILPTQETCDGKDNDCDGVIDDHIPPTGSCAVSDAPCGQGVMACDSGTMQCVSTCGDAKPARHAAALGVSQHAGCNATREPPLFAAIVLALWVLRARFSRKRFSLVAVSLLLAACGSKPAATSTSGGSSSAGSNGGSGGASSGLTTLTGTCTAAALNQPCFGAPDGVCADPAHAGLTICAGGIVACAGPNVLVPFQLAETCDGLDNDCDGSVDNNIAGIGNACGSNVGACRMGTNACTDGVPSCAGSIGPTTEICDGLDNDCDGTADNNVASGGACLVPNPPSGATSPCQAGTLQCQNGAMQCVGAIVALPDAIDACGVDSNCDGVLTDQPDLTSDVHNCGACGHDCANGNPHSLWSCDVTGCHFQNCATGFSDGAGSAHSCNYACVPTSATELCNGVDDNCDGNIDENPAAPSISVCGVNPAASAAECAPASAGNPGGVGIACVNGGWRCTFNTVGVCNPACAATLEVCDGKDNNCDGQVDENVPNIGQPCASDDGKPPPGDGVCRTTGTYACSGNNSTACTALRDLTKAGPELCDGIDNDCDGLIDEPFDNKGSNSIYFVKPVATQIAATTWITSYEMSRPSATALSSGYGDGYSNSAPAGATLDATVACSAPDKTPWFNVTGAEAEQVCTNIGGRLCSEADWQLACEAKTSACNWGYAPAGVACTTPAVAGSKFCNLSPAVAGGSSNVTATPAALANECAADWSGAFTQTTDQIFDITGNLRELTKIATHSYAVLGGGFTNDSEDAASCAFTFYSVDQTFAARDTGFRCCFDADPTL